MAKPATDPDKRMIQRTVRLTPQQWEFLERQKEELGVPYDSDALREIVEGLRTWFGLPGYQYEVLEHDMASRNHTWLSYLQEILARRYETLQRQGEETPKRK